MKFRPWPASILVTTILLAVYLAACNPGSNEEATAQGQILDAVSSNTPTLAPSPALTLSATPTPLTGTPMPPTEAAVLPTDTPVPPTALPTSPPPAPTETPVPPTPTKITGASFSDDTRDTMLCDSNAPVRDLEVDITQLNLQRVADGLSIQVKMFRPLANDYSFALALFLVGVEEQRSYIWEIHEGVFRIGEMDPGNSQLIVPADPATIDYNQRTGMLNFIIPISSLTETNFQLGARSFHTAEAGVARSCDVAGMFAVPAELFHTNSP